MKGLEITYKNGFKDWYDPIDPDKDIEETEELVYITVVTHVYPIIKESILSTRNYDLCELCGYEMKNIENDAASCSKYDCKNNKE
jgi:hypothetical protein